MQAMRKSGASVLSRFDQTPYVPDEQQDQPIKPSGVVDPSAAMVDPDNKNFMPSSKDELKMAVQAMLSDIDNLEIPKTYELIKKSIDKMREEQTMKQKKQSSVEETLRRKVRKMLSEYWAKENGEMVWKGTGPAPKLAAGAAVQKFSTEDPKYQAGLKRLRTAWTPEREGRHDESDADAILKAIALRVKSEDPVGSIKRAARYLKDKVPGDVGTNLNAVIDALSEFNPGAASKMKSALQSQPKLLPKEAQTGEVSRDEIAKAMGVKHGTNIRNLEQIAMEKFKKVADIEGGDVQTASMKDTASIAVMYAMQDFIEVITGPAKGLFSPDDVALFKSNPEMATELATFRVFLDPYLDVLVEDPENAAARAQAKAEGMRALKGELKRAMKGKSKEFADLM